MTTTTAPAVRRPRNGIGVLALVLEVVVIVVPVVAWIVVAIVGAVESASLDDAVFVALLGGLITYGAVVALLSPVAVAGIVLGIVSLFRRDRGKAAGIVAIVLGVLPAVFGLLGLPVVLGEILPR